jgi:NADP-reducing hydrogenase subunit HndD
MNAREKNFQLMESRCRFSISTRELASFIKQANIDFKTLHDEEFDSPMGESTGAGVIFGATGGVIEAACTYSI